MFSFGVCDFGLWVWFRGGSFWVPWDLVGFVVTGFAVREVFFGFVAFVVYGRCLL